MYEIVVSHIYTKDFEAWLRASLHTQMLVKMLLFKTKTVCRINAYIRNLPSHTVHLCKSLNMESKGYIHKKCRINLWNRNIDLCLFIESLPKAGNSNSHRTLHRKHWSSVQISEQLHDCPTSFFEKTKIILQRNLACRNLNLETWNSILASRRSSRDCQLTFEH